ncbi:T9SS type A sorting domain-containing protein [uncultured Hymenobacter sp.]|uniref:T9SS type A sorting domain-containing protein n=1 Tax=uncultured Hymenobacter sp. TaxID=170016 RepID=UPI0035CBE78A
MQLKIYPNPATDQVTLELANNCHLLINDALGRTVSDQVMHKATGTYLISLAGLTPGIYRLRVILDNGETGSTQLLVQ